jgi:hypothetical protein
MSGLVTGDTEFHTVGFFLARGDEVVGPDSINEYWQARSLSAGVLTAIGDCFPQGSSATPHKGRRELGWEPIIPELDRIISTALW